MLRKQLILSATLLAASTTAMASPGLMFGISYNFGGTFGITVKALTSNKQHRGVGEVGLSYFPTAPGSKFGVDAGAGYNFHNGSVTLGWDFLNSKVQLGAGYVNTVHKHQPAPAPAPAPAPIPM